MSAKGLYLDVDEDIFYLHKKGAEAWSCYDDGWLTWQGNIGNYSVHFGTPPSLTLPEEYLT